MTNEELQQLKPGDDIFIRAKYVRVLNCGGVFFSHFSNEGSAYGHTLPSNVILPPPSPKYDPCRPFKEGDIVTPIERDGREVPDGAPVGEKCTVVESEKNGIVCIRYDAGSEHYLHDIPYFYLELVTPVEELEPYFVMELKGAYGVYNTRFQPETEACHFFTDMHPNAKGAAEAECARLNAEHRKEQTND